MKQGRSFSSLLLCLALCFLLSQQCIAYDWTAVDDAVQAGITAKAYPGAVVAIGDQTGLLYQKSYGSFTYDKESEKMQIDTIFDIASVTKVLATTTAVAMFYDRGELALDVKVSEILPLFAQNDKEEITVRHLLLHNSGLPADPTPNYLSPNTGCPESFKEHPELSFSCQEMLFLRAMNQTLSNPIGTKYVYSDLSMITLSFVVGALAKKLGYVTEADIKKGCPIGNENGEQLCYFEAYVRKSIYEPLKMKDTGFIPSADYISRIPPLWNDTEYRHEFIRGYVSDENAFAFGGIAGHAGLFSTVPDTALLLRAWNFPEQQTEDGSVTLFKQSTVDVFRTVANVTMSERALGFDTMARGPGSCGELSNSTFLHLGYTGTQVCNDPERKLFTVFFTNRGYPEKLNFKISEFRKKVNTAIKNAYDAGDLPPSILSGWLIVLLVISGLVLVVGLVVMIMAAVECLIRRNKVNYENLED